MEGTGIVEEAGLKDSATIAYVAVVHAINELKEEDCDIGHVLMDLETARIFLRHWAEQNG